MSAVMFLCVTCSPEFEIALFTTCFLAGGEGTAVTLGPYHVIVKCHKIGRNMIGTAYPEAAE